MKLVEHLQYTEIVADDGKFIYRNSDKGKPNFFTRGSMLAGETINSFTEVTAEQREEIEAQYPEEIPEELENINE